MAILKNIYVFLGFIWFGLINYFSYTRLEFDGPIGMKILYSIISFILLSFLSLSILMTPKIYKKEFIDFSLTVRIMFILGIIIVPLISLYYT